MSTSIDINELKDAVVQAHPNTEQMHDLKVDDVDNYITFTWREMTDFDIKLQVRDNLIDEYLDGERIYTYVSVEDYKQQTMALFEE